MSSTGVKTGRSIAGMPSFGGPPERISRYSIEVLVKSVFGHSPRQRSGLADAPADHDSAAATNSQAMQRLNDQCNV
jgi:hypothetical protein